MRAGPRVQAPARTGGLFDATISNVDDDVVVIVVDDDWLILFHDIKLVWDLS